MKHIQERKKLAIPLTANKANVDDDINDDDDDDGDQFEKERVDGNGSSGSHECEPGQRGDQGCQRTQASSWGLIMITIIITMIMTIARARGVCAVRN